MWQGASTIPVIHGPILAGPVQYFDVFSYFFLYNLVKDTLGTQLQFVSLEPAKTKNIDKNCIEDKLLSCLISQCKCFIYQHIQPKITGTANYRHFLSLFGCIWLVI